MNTIEHFERIIALAKENGLSDGFFQAAGEHLESAGALLHTNPVETAIFALILERFETSVSVKELAEDFKCSKMMLLKHMDDLDTLRQKKLIKTMRVSRRFHGEKLAEYTVPLDVMKAIRGSTEYQCRKYDNLSPDDFFFYAEELMDDYANSDHEESYQDEMNNLLSHNTNVSFVKKRREYELDYTDMIIMLVFCIALLNDEELIKISALIRDLRHTIDRKQCKAAIDILNEKKLIEYEFRNGLADTEYCRLTQKAKDEFLDDVEFNEKPKRTGKYFIPAEKIPEKKLFYGDRIKTSIGELAELLREVNFSCIQKRLAESGMRTGFACIFSGPPGTGKTETAYQIARETGRDIMVVDISETKSMWFGESEKRIKEVFNRYRAVVNRGGLAPILLFNEADAVLGKRRELSEKREGPGQTENAIQNIILQEMEDLNGILIATTNMTSNLDNAFERRFLYKIEFEKPDSETKKFIWQSLMPELSGGDAVKLAATFDFSGGQIENIARKSTVSFILKGSSPDLSSLEKFCREELMEKAAVKIGFGA